MKSPAWGGGADQIGACQAPKGKDTISHEALPANYTLVCGKLSPTVRQASPMQRFDARAVAASIAGVTACPTQGPAVDFVSQRR